MRRSRTGMGRGVPPSPRSSWGYGTVRPPPSRTTCSNGKATVTVAGASPSALNGTSPLPRRSTFTGGTATVHATYARAAATGAYGLLIRAAVRQRPGRRCDLPGGARRPTRRDVTPTATGTDEHPDRDRDQHPDGDQHADGPAERRPDPDADRDEPPGHGLNPGPTRGLLRQHRHVVQVSAEPAPSPADRGRRRFVVRRQEVGCAGRPGGSARRHPQGAVEADDLAVEHRVVHDVRHQRGVLAGPAQA